MRKLNKFETSSGTMAKVFGTCNYEEIDRRTALVVTWVEKQSDDKRWQSWMDVVSECMAS